MKRNYLILLLLPWTVFTAAVLPAQTEALSYEVYANKGKVGTWEIMRTVAADGQVHYTGKRTILFKMVQKIKTETLYDVRYLNGQLQQADIQVSVNGDPRRRTTIRREGDATVFAAEGQAARRLEQPVECSNLSVFFAAPDDVSTIFYLQKGIFLPVKPLGDAGYEVDLGKGEHNKYYYQDGLLVRAVLEDGLLRTTLKLVKARRPRPAPLAGKE